MTVENLPARRTRTAVAVITTAQPTKPASSVQMMPALRLSTALTIVSFAVALLAAASYYAGRNEQAGLCAGAAGALLAMAVVEWCRKHPT
ncbi:hypothetical protein ACH4T9_12730 [Micromonospora sp. NPDC020750]|uniref:hypothetical protein n=1 Tax=unclassified Micromonospora TaxID=2617518 RepID=UPI00378D5A39